jgi:formate hydrogenlyase subunit 4
MTALLHLLILFVFPPFLLGVIGKTKAWFGGRKGAPVLQTYADLWKLFRKGAVYSTTTTWVFRAGPIVSLSCLALAGLLIPLAGLPAPVSFSGDLILFAYLLGLGRFFTALAAMDTGSSFEGMGASREMTFSALAEPGLVLVLVILGVQGRTMVLADALQPAVVSWSQALPVALCLFFALGTILLAENSRIPVDDPATHLELTMVHEVMVLDHGGVDLAFVEYGRAIKLFLISALMVRGLVPLEGPVHLAVLRLLVGSVAVAVLVGIVESVVARLRLTRVPQFLLGATALGVISLCILFWRGVA